MHSCVELSAVTKSFGSVAAVKGLSLVIPKGCIYGFLGPNGAGKTTIMRMIAGIFYPDSGTVNVLGSTDPARIRSRIGYLPEEKGMYKKMKTAEMIAYFGMLKGMEKRTAREKALALLEQHGLKEWAFKSFESLSKGMGQKVQLITTILHDPELLILDEPLSGLDPVNIETAKELVLELRRSGKTVIFSTHIMEHAEKLCDYVLLINKGEKIIDGPLSEVKAAHGMGVEIDYEGDGTILRTITGISRINDTGRRAEIFMEDGADPQALLAAIAPKMKIRRFEIMEPSLHEIFIRAVGTTSEHAGALKNE